MHKTCSFQAQNNNEGNSHPSRGHKEKSPKKSIEEITKAGYTSLCPKTISSKLGFNKQHQLLDNIRMPYGGLFTAISYPKYLMGGDKTAHQETNLTEEEPRISAFKVGSEKSSSRTNEKMQAR